MIFLEISYEEKLTILKEKRSFSAHALATALKQLLNKNEPFSEVMLRNAWRSALLKDEELSKDGWYFPPPHGMGILFGRDEDGAKNRISYKSLRIPEKWPSEGIFLDREKGMIVAYASPVDLRTGIIADFGITLYFGKDERMCDYLKQCYSVNKEIFDGVKVGLRLKDVHALADNAIRNRSFQSEHLSVTDRRAPTNTGHTIPASFESWTESELRVIHSNDWEAAKTIISAKREFVNQVEERIISPGFAFTIEPRPYHANDPSLPQAFFHTVCLIHEDSGKEAVCNSNQLFECVGMDYMLDIFSE